jgi:hypothetical protein
MGYRRKSTVSKRNFRVEGQTTPDYHKPWYLIAPGLPGSIPEVIKTKAGDVLVDGVSIKDTFFDFITMGMTEDTPEELARVLEKYFQVMLQCSRKNPDHEDPDSIVIDEWANKGLDLIEMFLNGGVNVDEFMDKTGLILSEIIIHNELMVLGLPRGKHVIQEGHEQKINL